VKARPQLVTVLALAAVLAVGCGSDSAEPNDLAGALPGDPEIVSYLDIEAAREGLDLPDDADPADYDELGDPEDPTPEAELVLAGASTLMHVTEPFTMRFEEDATANAFDHTQVSAAASSQDLGGRAVILETDQPFDEIAEELEGAGFERDGDVLSGDSVNPEVAFPYVADVGDGRILVAKELAQTEEALAGDGEPGEAVELLGELEASQREVVTVTPDDSCITGFGVGGDPGGSELEIVLTVDGEADADAVAGELDLYPGDDPVALGEPEVDGESIRLSATTESDPINPSNLIATGAIAGDGVYDCG